MSEPSETTLPQQIELVTKGGVLAVATAYVVGLLITNVYIADWGFPTPTFTQARYVLVGFLWLFLVVLVRIAVAISFSFVANTIRAFRTARFAAASGNLALAVAVIAMLGPILEMLSFSAMTWNSSTSCVVVLLFSFANLLLAFAIPSARTVWQNLAIRKLAGGLEMYMDRFILATITFGLLFCIVVYSIRIYPLFPTAFGGGAVSMSSLSVADGKDQALRQMGIPIDSNRSVSAKILLEDSDTYYLLITTDRKNTAVRVPKMVFVGAVHLSEQK